MTPRYEDDYRTFQYAQPFAGVEFRLYPDGRVETWVDVYDHGSTEIESEDTRETLERRTASGELRETK